jgi:aconitate hydratase
VLTVTQMLRKKGVVGKFVEFYGDGLDSLSAGRPRDHRQHGARSTARPAASSRSTAETLAYLKLTGREEAGRAGRGLRQGQGMFRDARRPKPVSPTRSSSTSPTVVPSWPARSVRRTAGPRQRKATGVRQRADGPGSNGWRTRPPPANADRRRRWVEVEGVRPSTISGTARRHRRDHSCTNTSNPAVLIAAGLVARNARKRA